MDPFDAWIAGFMDGEGSVGVTTAGAYEYAYVVIAQHERYRWVLEEIQERYGGAITRCYNGGTFGKGAHSNVLRLDIRSQTQVHAILTATLPQLRVKKDRAVAALAKLSDLRKRRCSWTRNETLYLREHYNTRSAAAIAEALQRSRQAVWAKAQLEGLALARKTHCVHGHAFTPKNTYFRASGSQECRTCNRDRQRARHHQ